MTSTTKETFAVGSLVRARGREWVVLPESNDAMLVLRPLGGTDEEIAGVLRDIEEIEAATFGLPSPDDLGDDRSSRLLRDALRIGFRSSGGPFRSLAGLNVTPRPYQLVPLLLALRQDVVRLLVADDVGIGKTVEAGLVAAELLAQGSARKLAVLCPPSLAEQWRRELDEKFGIQAALVLPGTIRRLEAEAGYGRSVFEHFDATIVSTDFIKNSSRRDNFLQHAPDLVIVDEAHGVAADDSGRGGAGRTQRFQLVSALADDAERHLILVTATPHSGNDGAFRNLIGLLNPELKTVPLENEAGRRLLAEHMVQRRRADIRRYLEEDTKFPSDRKTSEQPFKLSSEHREFFDDVIAYVRGRVQDKSGTKLEQRIRWWSALSLLRSMASSPAAASATLSTRAAHNEGESPTTADSRGIAAVMDQMEDDGGEGIDIAPAGSTEADASAPSTGRQLQALARRAKELHEDPSLDAKVQALAKHVKALLKDGFHPIVFCRYIPTAQYVADYLRQNLKKVSIEVVTGELPAEERAARIEGLAEQADGGQKVLVATDCLSEGVNLQDNFQAVVHYDLAWNPTRHEQREGRVDRFGQTAETVRALLMYGEDNGIDGIVLDILLRKHERIRKDLGISVPVPPQSDQVLAALLEGVLMRGQDSDQLEFDLGLTPEAVKLDDEWRSSAESEKSSRTRFAQGAVHPDRVQAALDAARNSLGTAEDVSRFVRQALEETGAHVQVASDGFTANINAAAPGIRDIFVSENDARFVLDHPAPPGAHVLTRTDPVVARIAQYVLNTALDEELKGKDRPAARCGYVATSEVDSVTVALLVRFRTKLLLPARINRENHAQQDLAEEARIVAFRGVPGQHQWLTDEEVDRLIASKPSANVGEQTTRNMAAAILRGVPLLASDLTEKASAVAEQIQRDHTEVRLAARGDSSAGRLGIRGLAVEPNLPADILGVYIYAPAGGQQ
ncbi:helicase-related protein [Arthrobacter sp. S41]|uniref:helicase-related protein n=1 Tax=Arthrobacter sp. S41 TaxID=2509721 RepID=UPI00103560D8|nr:helicase-related protein [Arthrobacter sp. S41]TAP27840.1 helicase [Arthrobacter sp. S41]